MRRNGAWRAMPQGVGDPRRAAVAERRARIRALATGHPDWTQTRLAAHLGMARSTVGTALSHGSREPTVSGQLWA
jgi:hypothetical protein